MKFLLTGFLGLGWFLCPAQSTRPAPASFVYEAELNKIRSQEAEADFLAKIKEINQELTSQQGPTVPFIKGHYQLLGYRYAGWREMYPMTRTYFDQKLIARESFSPVTAQALLAAFRLALKDSTALLSWPVVMASNAEGSHLPPVLLNQRYFVLCTIQSYPHGNQTSWYNERIYYFKRVD